MNNIQINKLGILFYLNKVEKTVNPETYEPVSKESWKMLRDLEPGKFGLSYDSYVQLKKEQFDSEIERRKKSDYELISYHYNLYDIIKTKQKINEIKSDPLFYKRQTDQEIIDYILSYE
jgi:hypothetical protein